MIERDLDSMQGFIEFFVEVADPEDKLGIARKVAHELLLDGDRVRTILADHPGAADKFLAAQAAILGPETEGISDTDSDAQETNQPGAATPLLPVTDQEET